MLRRSALPRLIRVGCFTASLVLPARSALADSVTAEALFQSGREAMDKGDAKTACDRFEESYRMEPKPGTALNLGNCREQLGQVASAWQRFQEAAQTLSPEDARAPIAKQRAAALAAKVPKLVLRLPEGAKGWVVLRDGVELGNASLNLALPVDPGPHRLEVRAPGRAPNVTTVELAMSEQRELELSAGPLPAQGTVETPAPRPTSSGGTRALGWVLSGVGVAGVATSLVTGAMVMDEDSTVDRECVDKRCTPAGQEAADRGRTLATVSTIAAITGVASLGLGIYFLVSDSGTPQKAAAPRLWPRQAGVGLVSVPGGASFQLRASF
jgi:hypothetical protein